MFFACLKSFNESESQYSSQAERGEGEGDGGRLWGRHYSLFLSWCEDQIRWKLRVRYHD